MALVVLADEVAVYSRVVDLDQLFLVVEDICCSQSPSLGQEEVFQDRLQVQQFFVYGGQVGVHSVNSQMEVIQVVGTVVDQALDDSGALFVLVVGEKLLGLDLALGEVPGQLIDLAVVVDVLCDQLEQLVLDGQEVVHEGLDVRREVGGLVHHEAVLGVADVQLVVQEADLGVVVGAVVGADDGGDLVQAVLDGFQVVRGVDGGLVEVLKQALDRGQRGVRGRGGVGEAAGDEAEREELEDLVHEHVHLVGVDVAGGAVADGLELVRVPEHALVDLRDLLGVHEPRVVLLDDRETLSDLRQVHEHRFFVVRHGF